MFQGQQHLNHNSQSKDPLQFVRFKYNNPLTPNISQDVSNNSDLIQLYNSIQVPVINSLGPLMQNCESMRENYSALLMLSQDLLKEEPTKKNSNPFENKESSDPWNRASMNNSSSNKNGDSNLGKSNSMNSGYGGMKESLSQNPGYTSSMKISTVVREQDINSFILKFQCTRATAIGYLEAFGDFELACQEYKNNN